MYGFHELHKHDEEMIQDQIMTSIKEAMKAKDSIRLNALRGIKTAMTNELVAQKRTPQETLTDEDAIKVITRLAKQRKDSIEQFTKGNRPELAEKERSELAVLQEYLPEQLSMDEIQQIVLAKKEELGVTDRSKMGLLMGALMKELKGKADGNQVREAVNAALEG